MSKPSAPGHARTRSDPELAAAASGLRYVSGEEPGITRQRRGRGWSYRTPSGKTIHDNAASASSTTTSRA